MADRIIIVDDDGEMRSYLTAALEGVGYDVACFADGSSALRALEGGEPADLVITDLRLPGVAGGDLLSAMRMRPELFVIVITAFGTIESAVELMKSGAYSYLTKPFGTRELLVTIDRALRESRVRREFARLSREAPAPSKGFVGASPPMLRLFQLVHQVAPARQPVLITGESGTGKELVARALHQVSDRHPLVVLNCAALPEHLLESELFGHERGAFTGADRTKIGLFEAAHGGTLFLDEIGELPLALQPKLLRVLEDGEVRRVGATQGRPFLVRLVAATNRDLEKEVREGRFREDLYWRLNVLEIHVPSLRERPEDIPLLAEHLLAAGLSEPGRPARRKRISPDAMRLLSEYAWPGNVRELRNVIDRAATLSLGEEILPADLPDRIRHAASTAAEPGSELGRRGTLRDLEKTYILEVLDEVEGNKSRAAELLGVDRKTLYRKLAEIEQEAAQEPR